MPVTTPNSQSKLKQINQMNKPELMEEVRYHRPKEEYEKLIKELKKDVKEIVIVQRVKVSVPILTDLNLLPYQTTRIQ